MKNNQLVAGLFNYINSQDQFAVMIDGPWGSGKTYFLKNSVIPCIRKKHKAVYFSVYGYESLDKLKSDLISKLFISSLGEDKSSAQAKIKDIVSLVKGTSRINKKLTAFMTAFNSFASTAESILLQDQLRAQKNSASVLIVDDLERISREIHMSDLMGFLLTDIIESYGYRVIIVGYSQEIQKDASDDFNLMREKVISRIFPFTSDLKNVKKEFFQNSDIEFLRNNSDWLEEILTEYVQHNKVQLNLRTLEFILATFRIIDKNLNQYLNTNSEKKLDVNLIKQSAFANLFVIATEYRKGTLNRGNLSILDQLLNTRNFLFLHIKNDEKKSIAEEITIKYHNERLTQVIMYDCSMNDAVFNGSFNAQSFVEAWINLFIPRKIVSNSNLDKISNFRNMTDDELKELELQLLHDSLNPKATVKDILSTINIFLFFDQNDLYFGDTEYLSKLLDALKSAINKSSFNNDLLYDLLYDKSIFSFTYSSLAKNKATLKQVHDILKSAEAAKYDLNTTQLVNAIFANDYETIRNITQSSPRINIFRAILNSNHLKKHLLTTNSKAQLFNKYLKSNYIQISNSKDFHNGENPDISELINKIEKFTTTSTQIGRIDKFNLKELLTTLNDILAVFNK